MNDFETYLIQKIEKNLEKIKGDLQSGTKVMDFARYTAIKEIFDSGVNIENDDEFKKKYRTFYVMRFVTKEYVIKYFSLLNTKKFKTQQQLGDFLEETDRILSPKGKNCMQFSFTTKALHTVNNDLPIYDRFISKFFQLEIVPNDISLDVKYRIETRQRIYNKLVKRFDSLLSKDEIKKYIKEIRIILGDTNYISDAKMLDFIILSCEGGPNKNSK